MHRLLYVAFLLVLLPSCALLAQGIRGLVKDAAGAPLPYASIYVVELRDGASTNMQGRYEIRLPAGTYTLKVQYLGYQTQQLQVQVSEGWQEQEVVLQEQVQVLREVEISRRQEDPALTVMRKAITKRKYHLLQYDSYEVQVYMKGTGQVTDVPFFLKKKLKEEGLNVDEAYTSESVSLIKFAQPDKLEEKVISIRTSGENSGASPNQYINQSFYNDRIATAISPLSGQAFAYYKFRYEGSFYEGELEINKIRVTPRSRGTQVFEGHIYIISGLWAIHSLDLVTTIQGFQVSVKQNYAEVAQNCWMPVTHQYRFSGKILGFAGEFHYLASCRDYKVVLNQDLMAETQIIDEKIEDVPPALKMPRVTDKDDIVETLASEDKMTKKQFRKMINQYEKESLKEQKDPQIVSERSYSVDTLARKRDSTYWAEIRPVPLSTKELKGYQRDDSLARVESAKLTGKDSTGVIKKGRFKPSVFLLGGRFNLTPRTVLALDPTLTQVYYNTVEGFNVNVSGKLVHRTDSLRRRLELAPTVRYGLASEDVYAKGRISYTYAHKGVRRGFFVEGGKFVSQFNEAEPIHPHINTLSSLLLRRNFMKIYEKGYLQGGFHYRPSHTFSVSTSLEWAQRGELFDQSNYSLYNGEGRTYTTNQPYSRELADTGFPEHQALLFSTQLTYRPGITYRIYNGRKTANLSKVPELLLQYRKGIRGVLGSDVDFDHVQLGLNHGHQFGVSGKLVYELRAGSFLNNRSMYFMDYHHFDGNRTILSSLRPAGSFRLLDYYEFSTNNGYVSAHTHYQFRKFLLTQLPMLRFSGLKENVFVNYLKTGVSQHYYELGYSIDGILRLFRLELAASFNDTEFKELAPRIGIATIFTINAD
ncbi:DUF5686 and carboxypeptidase regulatory-like domain-containing protein [Cesiribacter andamanensis]|uniref:TonB-linked outer membrane protein, SusC/RagA family n=1 Tax=Cesiribacter andamanensis AMV16 TaxID=1279009 RepID=M7N3E4_9BACT|nr:DUF5686 and carboxypeptidase regulatory-like domain-containing protein [Cesiribacter andamanensis]EMR01792.1 TonB-linked outer membrane protein, SusC/RagA family [Cesiribacter andamanensis AMV16]